MNPTGPQNTIIGDNFGTDIPQTVQPLENLQLEKNRAKFSRTKEFGELKDYVESRIKYYQTYLPDGREVAEQPSPDMWVAANTIIRELNLILLSYETSAKVVDAANTKANRAV